MIDFNQMNTDWPQRRIGKNHAVSRAVGFNKYPELSILDATAGLARDAFIFAKLGANLTMLERNPKLAAMIETALADFNDDELKKNMRFIFSDTMTYLQSTHDVYDVIYLDPMFSDVDKRAKVKKDMQFLQELIGENHDADDLFRLALTKTKKRIVVKRHKLSPFLGNKKPHHQIIGKSTRYDVYLALSL
jgi:16S rRNA (guanine1516-N2)-methyltransferase